MYPKYDEKGNILPDCEMVGGQPDIVKSFTLISEIKEEFEVITEKVHALIAENNKLKRQVTGMYNEAHEVDQALGKALGYPELYPHVSTVDDGTVCTGEHTIGTLASEAARVIRELKSRLGE
jgi:hypothetical protein